MKRLYTIIMALATLVVSANAQSLSVANIEAQTGEETALVVSLTEGTSMTALQFNLSLPEGVTLDETAITKGTAASGHTLEVRPLTNGDRLFVLYHKENTPLANGELLRLPVTVGSEAGTFGGKLYTVRTATADAVSHKAAEANFSVTVKETIYIETEQTLALTEIPAMKYGDGTYQLPAKTNEGLNLTWTVGNNKVANISGNVLTIKKAGTTSISATQDGNSDYKAFNKSFTLTVAKAPLTITAQNCTKNVGEENPTLTVKYDGFVLGEDETVLTSQPTIQTEATTDSPVGTYDITASGAEAQNYEISYVKGTLTIEKKDEPEPITRNPFNGKIRLPGTLEAENFDRGGEGITYHDNDPGNNGGTNYRSGNDTGVDIVTGNGGYAVGWTNGGEWIEYTMNVTEAGMYTLEAMVSNGTGNKGGFSISLVGDGGRLTKLADVGISPTENWDSYQSVKGDLLQSLKTGTQVFRITITDGNCNIDKVKFEKKDEPGLTITADNKSMVYGDNVPSLTYKTSGATLSGTPKLSTTATKTSAVGTYTIKVEKGTVTNASVTYVDGTLTITKAPLTITAKSYTIKQGEALPTFAATYSGFKNSETESVLSKKPIFSCTATSSSAPGTYDITVSGAEAGNYDISYAKGTLTIEKKEESELVFNNTPLTKDMFKEWDGCVATSKVIDENAQGALLLNENVSSGGTIYGDGSVIYTKYANLTGCHQMVITGTPGMQLRVLMNRLEVGNGGGDSNGGSWTELNPTIGTDGKAVVDLSGYEFVHLNAIKNGWESPEGTISSIILNPTGGSTDINVINTEAANKKDKQIFTLDGKPVEALQQGVNIIKYQNGTTKKVLVK